MRNDLIGNGTSSPVAGRTCATPHRCGETDMTTRLIRSWAIAVSLLGSSVTGCKDPGTVNPVSDVPCLEPTAWPFGEFIAFLVRPEYDGGDVLLFVPQTVEQFIDDGGDGVIGDGPHGPVYRFDPEPETFELVDDSIWDDSQGTVTDCVAQGRRETAFNIVGTGYPRLMFDEEVVPVAGGAAVSIQGALRSAAVAVLSVDGTVDPGLIFGGFAHGQRFHQPFSEVDGSALGEAVRIGGTLGRPCWTVDEGYVIYYGALGRETPPRLICVVRIDVELPEVVEE